MCLSIRLGVVVGRRKFQKTATTVIKSKGLLTHEQALENLAGASLQDMAQAFNRKSDAIRMKLGRLGLKVAVALLGFLTAASKLVPSGLLRHEKVLPSNFVRSFLIRGRKKSRLFTIGWIFGSKYVCLTQALCGWSLWRRT